MTHSSASNKATSAAYSMGARIKSSSESDTETRSWRALPVSKPSRAPVELCVGVGQRQAPGPAQYTISTLDSRKRTSPNYSFGGRPRPQT